ncbi:hypothetical protein SSS_07823, partial [Sarcoptes scabiei]
LIEHLSPGSIDTKTLNGGDNKQRKAANIQKFLNESRRFGLNEEQLFEIEDLLSMLDMSKVTDCLFALGKQAVEKGKHSEHLVLGEPYDRWLDKQLSQDNIKRLNHNQFSRSGMPLGDDINVSHVDTNRLKEQLDLRLKKDAERIRKLPLDPKFQRTSPKSLQELRSLYVEELSRNSTTKLPPPKPLRLKEIEQRKFEENLRNPKKNLNLPMTEKEIIKAILDGTYRDRLRAAAAASTTAIIIAPTEE